MKRQQFKKQQKKRKLSRRFKVVTFSIVGLFLLALISLRIYAQVAGAPNIAVQKASVFLDQDEQKIGDYYISERRYWTDLENISPFVIDATVAVEDKDFYKHGGFDYSRIGGAILTNIKSGGKAQGASTITQQYARNLYLSAEKTWTRKAKEALYAYRLEHFYSKDEILQGYLNTVYYGHGMYGIEAASNYFFAKSAKDLSLAESAMLAGIPKGPTYYSPNANLEKATNRQHTILKLMLDQEKITTQQYEAALNEQLVFKSEQWKTSQKVAPYFLDAAWNEATTILASKNLAISAGGWTITTTLNQTHQKAAEKAIASNMPESELQVGFVSMEPNTGFVTSLIGGRDYTTSSYNRATLSKRQPGSAIKPFLYAAALENGYTPLTYLDVKKTTFTYDLGREQYTPKNNNDLYAEGEMSMFQALAISDNVYAVKTLVDIGYKDFRKILARFDLEYSDKEVPSIALGTAENSLYDLTGAYNIIASGGQNVQPTTILEIKDSKGNVVYAYEKAEQEEVISSVDAHLLTDMMTGMFDATLNDYSSATGASIKKQLTKTYAGKSGTTNSDQWMFGFTPSLTAGTWNGYDQGKILSGQNDTLITKKIWAQFMETALADKKNQAFEAPDTIERVAVDVATGKLAAKGCDGPQKTISVKAEDVPTEKCSSFNLLDSNLWDKIFDIIR